MDGLQVENKFCLISSLKGKAAEFVFQQLDPSTIEDFDKLVAALESRFAERLPKHTWLAMLESKQFLPKDGLTEYVADIRRLVMRGYPTADAGTRESIALRHFLKGLPDPGGRLCMCYGTHPRSKNHGKKGSYSCTDLWPRNLKLGLFFLEMPLIF